MELESRSASGTVAACVLFFILSSDSELLLCRRSIKLETKNLIAIGTCRYRVVKSYRLLQGLSDANLASLSVSLCMGVSVVRI